MATEAVTTPSLTPPQPPQPLQPPEPLEATLSNVKRIKLVNGTVRPLLLRLPVAGEELGVGEKENLRNTAAGVRVKSNDTGVRVKGDNTSGDFGVKGDNTGKSDNTGKNNNTSGDERVKRRRKTAPKDTETTTDTLPHSPPKTRTKPTTRTHKRSQPHPKPHKLVLCHECGKAARPSRPMLTCHRPHCRLSFHADCLLLPFPRPPIAIAGGGSTGTTNTNNGRRNKWVCPCHVDACADAAFPPKFDVNRLPDQPVTLLKKCRFRGGVWQEERTWARVPVDVYEYYRRVLYNT